jgi:hypothetical protein
MELWQMNIIDDVLPKEKFSSLKEKILNENFQWNFLPHTSYHIYNDGRDYQLNHPIFFDGEIQSYLYEEISSTLKSALLALNDSNLVINKFILIKVSALTNIGQPFVCDPIIYHTIPHKIGFLYFNDGDGGTVVCKDEYDKSFNLNPSDFREKILLNRLNNLSSIDSKENRMLIFDGFHYHSCFSPVYTKISPFIIFTFV